MENSKETVQAYFKAFNKKAGWEDLVSDEIVFDGETSTPVIKGKQDFVMQNQMFLMAVVSSSLDSAIAEENKVAVTASYHLALPNGDKHTLKTVEIYTVQEGKISNIHIAFDTVKFYEFMAKMPKMQESN